MKSLNGFLKAHTWVVFLGHQAFLFATAAGFLYAVRRLTGRAVHLGREPLGVWGEAALAALSLTVIALTCALYRWARGADAEPLGLAPSARRLFEMVLGAVVGFALAAWPWAFALASGGAFVSDDVMAHFAGLELLRVVGVGVVLLFLGAFTEEVANRAFPLRLWRHRALAFRVVVPSLFFAAVHLAGEPVAFGRFATLFAGGVIQSLAYLLTGDVWLASGLHFGANYAGFSASGLWHAGALAEVVGQTVAPNWVAVALMLATVAVLFALLKRKHDSTKNSPRAAGRRA
jgi:membrane protease YdiL (CAAX protease family)